MNLVWKSDERPTSNLRAAKIRMDLMTNSLTTDGFRQYDEHLEDLYQSRIIEYSHQQDPSCFFLSHRGIHRNGKLRVVFDGSAKDGSGRSLNSYLDLGVNLLSCLLSVIISFRADQVGCQSDIKAAFHQILIKEEARKYVQFLWADEILRFQRVPFGLSCSPFMLLQTIATHVHQHPMIGPDLRGRIERGIYMDDLCLSFPSADKAEASLKHVTNIFVDASIELHKLRKTETPSDESKVLSLKWDTVADHLAVIIPQQSTHPSTKSELLSLVSRPFDPLGVLTPWLIWGKIVLVW
ncbi:uncharacterized protein LOC123515858 [Portunus trituberculatus]|uniref:uncharacterized protein LOC123515858 n=1 Tax=Portunus trituberculatus TaxID=210409 RepID=UPI001E1D21F3|nr:uncharacterized protein LOC123515858 [Portunus trituberculatus]